MNFSKFFNKYFLLLIAVAWSLSYISQIHYDSWGRYSDPRISVSFNEYIEPQPLSLENSQFASFGATEFLADVYWLQLIQYYGGGDPYGRYRKLAELFTAVTDLSPKFSKAYTTGLLILPGEGFVDEAISLGEKGQQNIPDNWEIPYYTGLVHHIYKKDFQKAGENFNLAAEHPEAPAITKLFAGIYFNEADQRKTAFLIFQTLIETSSDEFVVDRAKKHLGHLDGLFVLEGAIEKYSTKFGKLPNSLNDLVDKKIISQIPVSPLSTNYSYNPETGVVSDSKI